MIRHNGIQMSSHAFQEDKHSIRILRGDFIILWYYSILHMHVDIISPTSGTTRNERFLARSMSYTPSLNQFPLAPF